MSGTTSKWILKFIDPFFRYLWTGGSYVKVNAADFLGKRQLEVTRGTNGYAMVVTQPVSVKTIDELKQLVAEEPGQWQLSQDVFDVNSNIWSFGAYTMLDDIQFAGARGNESRVQFRLCLQQPAERQTRIVASWDGRYHHYKIFKPGRRHCLDARRGIAADFRPVAGDGLAGAAGACRMSWR